jgi:molybdopterin-guanine dinucleotide biosynthesis protein A
VEPSITLILRSAHDRLRKPLKMSSPEPPIGAVLAGGRGVRIGGEKATVMLAGRPLISYPLAALQQVLDDVVVVAKASTALPELGVDVWTEPEEPRHPLQGIVTALRAAGDRPVVICPCDLPLLSADTVRRLAQDARRAQAVIVRAAGTWQPLLGCYRPQALDDLAGMLRLHPDRSLQRAVGALVWLPVDVAEEELCNVNTPGEVAALEQRLRR